MKLSVYPIFCVAFLLSVLSGPTFAQSTATLKAADSLYTLQNWQSAKEKYTNYLGDNSKNGIAWNRLGYCNYNLALYADAVKDYNRSLTNNPPPFVQNVVMARLARAYAMLNKTDEATDWLIKATATGYNSLPDLDSIPDFKNIRMSPKFAAIRQQVYETIYPCSKEPRAHDFDFWIGDWTVYSTANKLLAGHSHVESIAGGCAILENWTSTQAENGKSFNYYDPATGKWEQDWIDSQGFASARQKYFNGEYKNGAMHFTYEKTGAKGEKQTGNFIFYNIDKNTVRQYQDISTDGGKTLTVAYDLTYVRKSS